jgi:hypothetical protein
VSAPTTDMLHWRVSSTNARDTYRFVVVVVVVVIVVLIDFRVFFDLGFKTNLNRGVLLLLK